MGRRPSLMKQIDRKMMKATETFMNTAYFPLSIIDNIKTKNPLKLSIKQYIKAEKLV